MSTSIEQRFRLYRLEGETRQVNTQLPLGTYQQLHALAQYRGWSLSEAARRAIRLFLDQNKDIVDVLLSGDDGRSGT